MSLAADLKSLDLSGLDSLSNLSVLNSDAKNTTFNNSIGLATDFNVALSARL